MEWRREPATMCLVIFLNYKRDPEIRARGIRQKNYLCKFRNLRFVRFEDTSKSQPRRICSPFPPNESPRAVKFAFAKRQLAELS